MKRRASRDFLTEFWLCVNNTWAVSKVSSPAEHPIMSKDVSVWLLN